MKIYDIDLSNKTPNFSFRVSVVGVVYRIDLQWNVKANLWFISLASPLETLYEGIPLVAGINYFGYVNLPKMPENATLFVVKTPDYDMLGNEVALTVVENV
jgi:hypothetical protein